MEQPVNPDSEAKPVEQTQTVAIPQVRDYKSRKFILTSASLALFVVLLLLGKLSGEQFCDVYWIVLGSYLCSNVAYNWNRK